MKNPKRTFLIGFVVWLLFFGWWLRGFLYINWRFGLFSWDSWTFLFHEIAAGWRVSNRGDWIFLLSFILSFPLYFILWYWACSIRWESLLKKSLNPIQKIGKKSPLSTNRSPQKQYTIKAKPHKAPPITAQRPIAMPSFGPTMRTKPLQETPNVAFTNQPSSKSPDVSLENMPNISPQVSEQKPTWDSFGPDFREMAELPLSDIQLPQNQSVDENIEEILQRTNWTHLPDVVFEGQKVDMAVCQGKLILFTFDDESGDWLADEEAFNDEDPLWFSETDHRTSPVFKLVMSSKNLNKKLSDAGITFKIQPLLVERKGNLINAEDMLKTWNDMNVIVCRTASGGPVQLKTFSEVFNQPEESIQANDLEKIKQTLL